MSNSFTNDDIEQILRIVDRLSDVEVRLETGSIKLHIRKFSGGNSQPAAQLASEQPQTELPGPPPLPVAPRTESVPSAPLPVPPRTESRPASGAKGFELPANTVAIRAPMLGLFYRAPSPAEPPFVEVGSHVGPDDPVCMIEVMKLFKTVNAGTAGTIVATPVENASMVEYDQVLFLMKPDQGLQP